MALVELKSIGLVELLQEKGRLDTLIGVVNDAIVTTESYLDDESPPTLRHMADLLEIKQELLELKKGVKK